MPIFYCFAKLFGTFLFNLTTFSTNIKHLLRKTKTTQEELATVIGKKRSVVGSYVRGEAEPNLNNLRLIADHFQVNVDDLLKVDIGAIKELAEAPDRPEYGSGSSDCKGLKRENALLQRQVEILERHILVQEELINQLKG